MNLHCKLSGLILTDGGRVFAHKTFTAQLPIFHLPASKVLALAQAPSLSDQEAALIVLALAHKFPLIRLGLCDLRSLDLSASHITLSRILALWSKVYDLLGKRDFPTFSLTTDSFHALPAYLTILADICQTGRHLPAIQYGDSVASVESDERRAMARELAKASKARKLQDAMNLTQVLAWAQRYLQLSAIHSRVLRMAFTPTSLPTQELQDYIELLMCKLPDHGDLEVLRKSYLLDKLQAIMVERKALMICLGLDIAESTDYINKQATAYSLVVDGTSHLNMATETATVIASIQLEPSQPALATPKRQDYPDHASYIAALREHARATT